VFCAEPVPDWFSKDTPLKRGTTKKGEIPPERGTSPPKELYYFFTSGLKVLLIIHRITSPNTETPLFHGKNTHTPLKGHTHCTILSAKVKPRVYFFLYYSEKISILVILFRCEYYPLFWGVPPCPAPPSGG